MCNHQYVCPSSAAYLLLLLLSNSLLTYFLSPNLQRELGCGHIYHIVLKWCENYPRTARPCPPNVTNFEFRRDESCGMS